MKKGSKTALLEKDDRCYIVFLLYSSEKEQYKRSAFSATKTNKREYGALILLDATAIDWKLTDVVQIKKIFFLFVFCLFLKDLRDRFIDGKLCLFHGFLVSFSYANRIDCCLVAFPF